MIYIKTRLAIALTLFSLLIIACQDKSSKNLADLKVQINSDIDSIKGDIALAFINLSDSKDSILINENEKFHAASTMKVPVMIELFKQASLSKISLKDSILLKNEFKSIVDGSLYSMNIGRDGGEDLYDEIGHKVAIYDLMYQMITRSSNLATNILIELVDAKKVTNSMNHLGAKNIEVLRGVEDHKAYEAGLSNSTTALDLAVIMQAIAMNKAGTTADCEDMVHILKNQQFNDLIPLFLPESTPVAHKTGAITGVHHDMAIIYLPNGKSYVLIIMSKNLGDFDKGTEQLALISKKIYKYMVQKEE